MVQFVLQDSGKQRSLPATKSASPLAYLLHPLSPTKLKGPLLALDGFALIDIVGLHNMACCDPTDTG